jgi:hypothetical protein
VAYDSGLATVPEPENLQVVVQDVMFEPTYRDLA